MVWAVNPHQKSILTRPCCTRVPVETWWEVAAVVQAPEHSRRFGSVKTLHTGWRGRTSETASYSVMHAPTQPICHYCHLIKPPRALRAATPYLVLPPFATHISHLWFRDHCTWCKCVVLLSLNLSLCFCWKVTQPITSYLIVTHQFIMFNIYNVL